jgi:membrane-bound lytic murein transglycosylase A
MQNGFFRHCIFVLVLALIASSAFAWEKVENLPFKDDGDKRSLLTMLDEQAKYLNTLPNRSLRIGKIRVSRERLLATVKELRLVVLKYHGRPEFGLRIREKFSIYRVSNPSQKGKALFTGYYDPELTVSAHRTDRYRFPIYGMPKDLRNSGDERFFRIENGAMTPYFTRRQIDGDGVLAGKGDEIAWSDDYVSVFYLMVQGSGRVKFTNGRTRTIHYIANNGHPYKSAARACMNAGKCPGGYQKNLAWFRAHPAEARTYFYKNPRYIFFTIDDAPARGLQNIPLTAYRTIATDKSFYPPGAIAWVRVPMPDRRVNSGFRMVSMLVADGDTGSAIKGPGRADYYYGMGSQAEVLAGGTYGWGEMYYLLVK